MIDLNMEDKEQIIKNAHKTFFKKGDVVCFKGFEHEREMKVVQLVWQTDSTGTLKMVNGKKQLEGVLVEWLTEDGVLTQKLVDSRSLYIKEYSGAYHLTEAKKKFYSQGKLEIVEMINNILDKCA